jgi:hypothetical protein
VAVVGCLQAQKRQPAATVELVSTCALHNDRWYRFVLVSCPAGASAMLCWRRMSPGMSKRGTPGCIQCIMHAAHCIGACLN